MKTATAALLAFLTTLALPVRAHPFHPFHPFDNMPAREVFGKDTFYEPERALMVSLNFEDYLLDVPQAEWDESTLVGPTRQLYDPIDRMWYVRDGMRVKCSYLPPGLPFSKYNLVPVGVLGQRDAFTIVANAHEGTECEGTSGVNACNMGSRYGNMTIVNHIGNAYLPPGRYLIVPDGQNHRLLTFDVTGGPLGCTSGEAAVHVWGQPDFTSTVLDYGCLGNGVTDACSVRQPDLAYVAEGVIFIGGDADRLVAYDQMDFGMLLQPGVKVLGQPSLTHPGTPRRCDGTPATGVPATTEVLDVDACVIFSPTRVIWSASERILLVSSGNRINGYDYSQGTVLLDDIVTGQPADFVIGKYSATDDLAWDGVVVDDYTITQPYPDMVYNEEDKQLFVTEVGGIRVWDASSGLASLAHGAKAIDAMLGDPPPTYTWLAFPGTGPQELYGGKVVVDFTNLSAPYTVYEQIATRRFFTFSSLEWIAERSWLSVTDSSNDRVLFFGSWCFWWCHW